MHGSEPRQGRDNIAQGDSPGTYGPHFLLFPLPRQAGEGGGGEGLTQDTRLASWSESPRRGGAELCPGLPFHYRTGLQKT